MRKGGASSVAAPRSVGRSRACLSKPPVEKSRDAFSEKIFKSFCRLRQQPAPVFRRQKVLKNFSALDFSVFSGGFMPLARRATDRRAPRRAFPLAALWERGSRSRADRAGQIVMGASSLMSVVKIDFLGRVVYSSLNR